MHSTSNRKGWDVIQSDAGHGVVGRQLLRGGLLPILMIAAAAMMCSCGARGHLTAGPRSTSATATTPTLNRLAPACTARQLEVMMTESRDAVGLARAVLVFRNVSAATCVLDGYPAVTESDVGGGNAVPAAGVPAGYPPGKVPLGWDAVASAAVVTTSMDPACQTEVAARIALAVAIPAGSPAHQLILATPICLPLRVHPIVAGPGGRLVD